MPLTHGTGQGRGPVREVAVRDRDIDVGVLEQIASGAEAWLELVQALSGCTTERRGRELVADVVDVHAIVLPHKFHDLDAPVAGGGDEVAVECFVDCDVGFALCVSRLAGHEVLGGCVVATEDGGPCEVEQFWVVEGVYCVFGALKKATSKCSGPSK